MSSLFVCFFFFFVLSVELFWNKLKYDIDIEEITLFGSEFRLSQFAYDTNIFRANLSSVENASKTVVVQGVCH